MASQQPLYQQAAWASVLAPFIAVALTMCCNLPANLESREQRPDRAMQLVRGGAAIILTAVGFVFAMIGIVGAVRDRWGFLLPSLIGLVLNGGYLFSVIYMIIYIRQLVEQGVLQPR